MIDVEPKILLENKSVAILGVRSPDGRPLFMPTSWNLPVSYDPPMVMVCVGEKRFTHSAMIVAKEFTLSVPWNESMVARLGSCSGKDIDNKAKYLGHKYDEDKLTMNDCVGYVRAEVHFRAQFGTHLMVVGTVIESKMYPYLKTHIPGNLVWSIGGGKVLSRLEEPKLNN